MVKGIFRQSKTFFAISSSLFVWFNSSKVRQERLVTSFFSWPDLFAANARVIRGPLPPFLLLSLYCNCFQPFSSWDKETKPVLPLFLPSFLPSFSSIYKPFSQSSHSPHISSFILKVWHFWYKKPNNLMITFLTSVRALEILDEKAWIIFFTLFSRSKLESKGVFRAVPSEEYDKKGTNKETLFLKSFPLLKCNFAHSHIRFYHLCRERRIAYRYAVAIPPPVWGPLRAF